MAAPKNDREALVLALKLAITAPNETAFREVMHMAEVLAECLPVEEVEAIKAEIDKSSVMGWNLHINLEGN